MNRTEIEDYRDMRVRVTLRHELLTGAMICVASGRTLGSDVLIIQLGDGSHVARLIADVESMEQHVTNS